MYRGDGDLIYLGTSGFSFKDWIGPVYPENIKNHQMLKYYWAILKFNAVEINFTYYRMPSYKAIVSLIRRTPESFKFAVKVPKHITHEAWRGEYNSGVIAEYLKAIDPMEKEERLLIHLAQFPFSFKYSEDGLKYLKRISKAIRPLAVEFRHKSWDREETYKTLREMEITYVTVDEPQLKDLFPYKPLATTDVVYFRFHGRNPHWFDNLGDRYDYYYSDNDISKFAKDIRSFLGKVSKILVFFNNCHVGNAVKNAQRLREILGV